MALPPRLWLPDGVHELPTAVPAGQLAGLWPGSAAAGAGAAASAGAASTPITRLRRRALLRADAGLPERPVLIEWFPRADLDLIEAERRKGACHVHLLRLHHVGLADAKTAYAISEAPAGVDLLTVWRAAQGQLPPWWPVAVVAAAARGLLALHQHLQERGGAAHGGIELPSLFVAWNGAVQLLSYAPPGPPATPLAVAPEVRAAPRLSTPAADVYALGGVLKALLPPTALLRGTLARLLRRCLATHAEERPALSALQAALATALHELEMPLGRASAIGEVLGRVCPRAVTVDLADAEWGDSALAPFATMPATLSPLSPLSSSVVPLSPTWMMSPLEASSSALEKTVLPPPPAPRRAPVMAAAAAGLALIGGAALWRSLGPPLSPPLRPPAVASPPRAPRTSSFATATQLVPAAPATVPLRASADSVRWRDLRLQILHVLVEDDRERVLLQLRLTNASPRPAMAELPALLLGSTSLGERWSAEPPLSALPIGPGRTVVVTLAYRPPAASRAAVLHLQ